MLANIPLMKFLDESSPYFFASSTASLITTLNGNSLYCISYIASFKIAKSILEILSIFQSFFRFFSICSIIVFLFFSIPNIASIIYYLAMLLSIFLFSINRSIDS